MSRTVRYRSWAGPIFQSCPRASGAVQRLGYSRGGAALILDRLLFRPDISPVGAAPEAPDRPGIVSVSMVRTWLSGTLALIAVPHARPAQQTRSMFAAVSAEPWCEQASAGSPERSCACASFIWPSYDESYPKAGCGWSGGISVTALRPPNQIHCSPEPLLRRSVCAACRPACPQLSQCIGLSVSDGHVLRDGV